MRWLLGLCGCRGGIRCNARFLISTPGSHRYARTLRLPALVSTTVSALCSTPNVSLYHASCGQPPVGAAITALPLLHVSQPESVVSRLRMVLPHRQLTSANGRTLCMLHTLLVDCLCANRTRLPVPPACGTRVCLMWASLLVCPSSCRYPHAWSCGWWYGYALV